MRTDPPILTCECGSTPEFRKDGKHYYIACNGCGMMLMCNYETKACAAAVWNSDLPKGQPHPTPDRERCVCCKAEKPYHYLHCNFDVPSDSIVRNPQAQQHPTPESVRPVIEKLTALSDRADRFTKATPVITLDDAIAAVSQAGESSVMGEWHSADSSLKGTAKSIPCESEAPARSEISDNAALVDEVAQAFDELQRDQVERPENRELALEAILVLTPRLSQPSVSVYHLAKLLHGWDAGNSFAWESGIGIGKYVVEAETILKHIGVPYVT